MESTESGEKIWRRVAEDRGDNVEWYKEKFDDAMTFVRHLEYAPQDRLTVSCRLVSSLPPSSSMHT